MLKNTCHFSALLSYCLCRVKLSSQEHFDLRISYQQPFWTSSLEVPHRPAQYKQLNMERTASVLTTKLFVNASGETVIIINIFAQNPHGYAEHSLGRQISVNQIAQHWDS